MHGMDALRAVAMWLGVVLHAIIPYKNFPIEGWPIHSNTSLFFDFLFDFIHSFRMPLFFLVAGFFGHLLVEKIGTKEFIKHRFKRIFIPFLFCFPIIIPISSLPFHYYRMVLANENFTIMELFSRSLLWTGLYHIWFLYYLLIYYALMLLSRKLFKSLLSKIIIIKDSWFLVITISGCFLIQYFLFVERIDASTSIVPKIPQLTYYGFFFLIGYFLYNNPQFLYQNKTLRSILMVIGILFSIGMTLFEVNYLLYSITISVITMLSVLGFFMLFMTYFDAQNPRIKYISDCSYWFYLIHLFLVVTMQNIFIEININPYIEVIIIIGLTSLLSIITYSLFIRKSIIGLYLNGKR